jgi:zinc/manganese transport system substrate-binding protein
LDASQAIKPLEVPQVPSRAMGDVHPGGNPHYMLDPENSRLVARLIAAKLAELAPGGISVFQQNLKAFESRLDENLSQWNSALAPYKGIKYVSYHKNLPYFSERFGLLSVGEIEPKPGIPPTAVHTAELIARMKADKVGLILTQPYYEDRSPASIAGQTGAKVVVFSMAPDGDAVSSDYLATMDANVRAVQQALASFAGVK